MKSIAYYITAHGYGHGARSCDILTALRSAAPDARIIVKTDLPIDFMESRLAPDIEIYPGAFDVGLIQKDAIHIDLPASLQTNEQLYAREEELILQETTFLRNEHISTVVADIPAIPLAAARQAGIPNIACGNFGWDWIYSDFVQYDPRWQLYVDKFRSAYEKTDLLLRQPFAEPMNAFPNRVDLPLLARPGTARRETIAKTYGVDTDKKWILLSFIALNLGTVALGRLAELTDYIFFTVEPLNWGEHGICCISRSTASFSDILASMDAVVTKPGFGIVSECIANSKPILYSERDHFAEYPILVEAIERYCRHGFLSNRQLYSGDLEQALQQLETAPPPRADIARGGADTAARYILQAT